MKRRSKIIRVDEGLSSDFDEIRSFRVANRLDKPRDLSDRELTRMMRNAQSYRSLLNEMKLKPRRKNGKTR